MTQRGASMPIDSQVAEGCAKATLVGALPSCGSHRPERSWLGLGGFCLIRIEPRRWRLEHPMWEKRLSIGNSIYEIERDAEGMRLRGALENLKTPLKAPDRARSYYPPTTAVAPATMTPRETRNTAIVRSKMAKRRETDMTRYPLFFTGNPPNLVGLSDLDSA